MPCSDRQRPLSPAIFLLLVVLGAWCAPVSLLAETPHFVDANGEEVSEMKSNNGVVNLIWSLEAPEQTVEFELQQADNEGFTDPKVRYHGVQRSSILTGLPEGDHYFRLRVKDAEAWSAPLKLEVRFINRGQMLGLLAVGFLVTALTVGAILTGYNKERKEGGKA